MDLPEPVILISTEPKENGHYFTPAQLERFNTLYPRNPASSYTIKLYAETQLITALQRVAELERALSGVLFDFDDGVDGGLPHRAHSLDYARQLCPPRQFKKKHAKRFTKTLN